MTSRLLYIILLINIIVCVAQAQQEQLYTQFMFHKQEFNPSAAALDESLEIQGLYRTQWIGLDGAPTTQKLGIQTPINKGNAAIGLTLLTHQIGITNRFNAIGFYRYAFPISSEGKLSLGMNARFRHLAMDFRDPKLVATQNINFDPSLDRSTLKKSYFNFGGGAFLYYPEWYLGISAPSFLENSVVLSEDKNLDFMERRHYYLMAGYDWAVRDEIHIVPQLLLRMADNVPLSFDLNINGWFQDKYLVGLTGRSFHSESGSGTIESLDVLAGLWVNEKFLVSVSYDIGLTKLNNYHSGSLEINLTYRGDRKNKKRYVNPRFL